MIIDLNAFEQTIDPTILQRGLTYFKQGRVAAVEHNAGGEVCATIKGSDTYTAKLKIAGDKIIENTCNCPYDMGPVCKHVVALIFYLKQDELGIKARKTVATQSKSETSTQKRQEAMQKTLAVVSKEQLAEFVGLLCSQNRGILREFLSRYQPQEIKTSKTHYKTSLSAMSHALTHRGFMDYNLIARFSGALDQTLCEADNRIKAGDYRSAIGAACAVLEEATKAINHCDDSCGCIGSAIDSAKNLLILISLNTTDPQIQKALFDYCIKTFNKALFKGWDWHLPLLEIALNVATTPADYKTLDKMIESEVARSKASDWLEETAMEIKAKFIAKTAGEAACRNYMADNVDIASFRQQLIEYNLQTGNRHEAKRLAQQGATSHREESRWRKYLLKIAESENDKAEVVAQARILLLGTDQLEDPQSYITILKSWLNAIEWIEFKLQLKSELDSKSGVSSLLLFLAEYEKDWELYYEQISKSTSYANIADAEKILPTEYHAQIARLYAKAILENMSTQVGRNHYIEATRYIRRIIKLGERDLANSLIDQLRTTYKQRSALMNELDKV